MKRGRVLQAAVVALIAMPLYSHSSWGRSALVGATLIDGSGRSIEDAVVLVEDDRLRCVGRRSDCPLEDGAAVTDLSGAYITPGLIDAHVHFAQTGWFDGRPDARLTAEVYPYEQVVAGLRADPGRWHRAYLCSGVTAAFDVGGAPWTVGDPHAVDTARSDRVHVRAAGPLISHAGLNEVFAVGALAEQPVFLPMESAEQVRADVARLARMGAAAVKVWYLPAPPERRDALEALLFEAGKAARENNLPLIVHATELQAAKLALKAGARMLVHSVEDEPVDQDFLQLLLANDATYAPTLTVTDGWRSALASVAFGAALTVDDPNRCVDQAMLDMLQHPERLTAALHARPNYSASRVLERVKSTGRQEVLMEANLRAVRDAGGRIALATDAGNPLTLHGPSINREMEAMQAAGLSPAEVLRAATLEGARVMGLADRIGSLEPGKMADLLVLAEDPRKSVTAFRSLTQVMRAGVLKRQEALRVR